MPNLGFVFNTADVPESNFEPIPVGKYKAIISESDMKLTKSGDGEFIELKIEIIEGEHAGRIFFERLNVKNKNEQAVEIAYQLLAKICKALNKNNIESTEEIHNIRFVLNVGIKEEKPYKKADGTMSNGSLKNVISGYESIVGNKTTTPAATITPTPSNSGNYVAQQSSITGEVLEKKLPWKK